MLEQPLLFHRLLIHTLYLTQSVRPHLVPCHSLCSTWLGLKGHCATPLITMYFPLNPWESEDFPRVPYLDYLQPFQSTSLDWYLNMPKPWILLLGVKRFVNTRISYQFKVVKFFHYCSCLKSSSHLHQQPPLSGYNLSIYYIFSLKKRHF